MRLEKPLKCYKENCGDIMTRGGWSRGLTKETDERVRKNAEAISLAVKGANNHRWKGGNDRILTSDEIEKRKIMHRIANIKYREKNREHLRIYQKEFS